MADTLLITGASQLLTLGGSAPRRGASLSDLGLIRNGALLIRSGRILAVGPRAKIESSPAARLAEKLDVSGRVILPGFVDSHTHLIHAASRAEEYELKIKGASYEEIARKGGGILNSVKKLRAATAKTLKARASAALEEFASYGTTTIEAKSGYGLDVPSELKILSLHKELSAEQPIEIVSTFLGAHVVPAEFRKKTDGTEKYMRLLVRQLLPEVAGQRLAEFCDVFCDRGAFTRDQSQYLLQEGQSHGLAPRIHAEQLSHTGATQLAVQLGAASCDHLEQITDADIRALAKSDTSATLLPGCDFHLGSKQYAPARKLIDAGSHRFAGDRLQSRHQPNRQHAHGIVSRLQPTSHESGRSNLGCNHQCCLCPAARIACRFSRTGQTGRRCRLRCGGLSRNSLLFWDEPLLDDHQARRDYLCPGLILYFLAA